MVVVHGQRGAAGEPEDLPALDLDRRRERHEHALVVVRVVDDFQMAAALRSRGRCGEGKGERAACKSCESGGNANGFPGGHVESSLGLKQERPGEDPRGVLFWEGIALQRYV